MRPTSFALVGIMAVVLAGCGTPAAPALAAVPAAQLPTGFVLQSADKYGVSIGIPPGWKSGSGQVADTKTELAGMGADPNAPVQTGNAGLDATLKGMDEENKRAEAEAMAEFESKGYVIHVVSTAKGVFAETPTHYSVRVQPNTSPTLEGAATSVLERVPGEEKPVPVTLPAGPAMVIHALKKMRDGGEVTTSKYVLQDGKTMIVVAFVTEADPGTIKQIEKPVMDTLRIVPGKAVPPPGAKD
jgi:hypothetical protein